MLLIIGLGNPGKEYEQTRHNAGFLAVDAIAKKYDFPAFLLSKKHAAMISEGTIETTKVMLAKPQTFMNTSGATVKKLLYLHKKAIAELTRHLIVIHDDIDIPLGNIKIVSKKGSAGHKGVESIIQALGTKNFTRIRIGICPAEGKPKNVEDFVLRPFQKSELHLLQSALQNAMQTLTKLSS